MFHASDAALQIAPQYAPRCGVPQRAVPRHASCVYPKCPNHIYIYICMRMLCLVREGKSTKGTRAKGHFCAYPNHRIASHRAHSTPHHAILILNRATFCTIRGNVNDMRCCAVEHCTNTPLHSVQYATFALLISILCQSA